MPQPLFRLSQLFERTDRRSFLTRASAMGVGAALAACGRGERAEEHAEHAAAAPAATGASATAQDTTGHHRAVPGSPQNPDSKLDTALHHPHHPTSATPSVGGAAGVAYHRFDPALPPLTPGRTKQIHFTAREAPVAIRPDVTIAGWTFEGDIPGPIVHVRQGDTVEFTLTNQGTVPHSMDFHAAQIDPRTAFKSVPTGQSVSYTFKPRYPGAFMYHCGTAPVLMHIGSGMFGAIIVDPPSPLPPAKEFVLIQNEYYLNAPVNGIAASSYPKMLSTLPDYVAFNGRPSQYQDAPIRVKRGDRVRFYVLAVGPTASCAFHVVGEQFDTVYLGAPPANAIHGVQTFQVPAGGGMIFELLADVPGEFPFVNHAFGHGQKGAIGVLLVEE